jgi:hypothetical protein
LLEAARRATWDALHTSHYADEDAMIEDGTTDHEKALIEAFIIPQKQQRLLDLLTKPKRRAEVLATLPHFSDLDERFVVHVPTRHADKILEMLRARGAPRDCYLISADPELDRRIMPLVEALAVIGGTGTLVSCIPGRLGYFEGERYQDRWILDRGAG